MSVVSRETKPLYLLVKNAPAGCHISLETGVAGHILVSRISSHGAQERVAGNGPGESFAEPREEVHSRVGMDQLAHHLEGRCAGASLSSMNPSRFEDSSIPRSAGDASAASQSPDASMAPTTRAGG